MLMVAHRFSTIQMADRVLVLENGKLAEQGTQAQLLQRQGAYCRLLKTEVET